MKTVELKLANSIDALKNKIPNIVILKGKNLKISKNLKESKNNYESNTELKSFSLKYFGMLDEKLVIASKNFRTTCDKIDIPLYKSHSRKKIKLGRDDLLSIMNYSEKSKSEKSNLFFPLLTKLEKNNKNIQTEYTSQNESDVKEGLEKFCQTEVKNSNYNFKRKIIIPSESDISLKNIKVIDSFKSFKESQVPISFRCIVNKKPFISHCEIVNGNRYNMKSETVMNVGGSEIKNKNKKIGFEGKKIGEYKNIFLPKYLDRIKISNFMSDPLIKEEKIQFRNGNGISLYNIINTIN